MRKMLIVLVGEDPVTVVDEARTIVFDILYNKDSPKVIGSLERSDVFADNDDETRMSYELDLDAIKSVEFERNGDSVTIIINRDQPETVTFVSSILQVWFPSPDTGSHKNTVIILSAIAHGSRFRVEPMLKKNYYCDVEVHHSD